MPKFQEFIPIPGPKLMEAIGLVSVKWAALEFQLNNLLFWASDPEDQETAKLLKEGSFKRRLTRLTDTLKAEHGTKPGTSDLIKSISKAGDIKGERDRIIHGVYGAPDKEIEPQRAIAILLKGHKINNEWPLTRPRVIETAQKIDRLVSEIWEVQIRYGTPLGNSILPQAWRHKSRPQD